MTDTPIYDRLQPASNDDDVTAYLVNGYGVITLDDVPDALPTEFTEPLVDGENAPEVKTDGNA